MLMADDDMRGSTPRPDPTLLTTDQLIREISHLKELINLRFELIERQRIEQKEDAGKALDAALLTAKDSVSSLAAASELQRSVMTTVMDDLKSRVVAVESQALGASLTRAESLDTKADSRGTMALFVAGASVLLTLIITIVNEIVVHMGH
jgi:hypothetical protein